MLSGLLDAENVSNVLRGIAQKRQNGVLEINFADRAVHLIFSAGKIVDVCEPPASGCTALLERLIKAGIVEDGFETEGCSTFSDLFLALNDRPTQPVLVDEELFRRAVKHRMLDILYRLDFREPAVYAFKVQMPEFDRHFAPPVSVSQILLDRVALETDGARFHKLFASGALVKRSDHGGEALSEEEQILSDLAAQAIRLEELALKSLLSIYHFQSSLLSLYDRAAVEVESGADSLSAHDQLAGSISDDVVGALESSSERPFIDSMQFRVSAEEESSSTHPTPAHSQNDQNAAAKKAAEPAELRQLDEPGRAPAVEEELETISVNRFYLLNSRLLQSNMIPNLIAFALICAASYAAFAHWGELLAQF